MYYKVPGYWLKVLVAIYLQNIWLTPRTFEIDENNNLY